MIHITRYPLRREVSFIACYITGKSSPEAESMHVKINNHQAFITCEVIENIDQSN